MNFVTSLMRGIQRIWRPKRMRQFAALLRPAEEDVVLDVGGYPQCWVDAPMKLARVDILNLDPIDAPRGSTPEIRTVVGDGCALAYPDGSYQIVYSNSVIEHVGEWDKQQQFAAELRRVGRRIWVQTPAFACPIEPHCLAPFIHWLPWGLRKHVMWLTPVALFSEISREGFEFVMSRTRILRRRELSALFPDCEIYTERMFGFIPKSYVAYRLGQPAESFSGARV